MLATVCGRFRLELAPEMGGEAGVLEKQISSFTLAVDGGLHMYFHDRAKVPFCLICHMPNPKASCSDPKDRQWTPCTSRFALSLTLKIQMSGDHAAFLRCVGR